MKKRILTLLFVFALFGAAAFSSVPLSARASDAEMLFRFGFAAEYDLSSPDGTVEFIADNGAGIVYTFDGNALKVTAKDASGATRDVAETTVSDRVSLDFRWTGSAYKTKIDGTEYDVAETFGESVATKASMTVTGSGVSLSGTVRDGGIVSRATVLDNSSVLTDLGDGLYNIKGNAPDNMVVRMDPVKVTDGSIVRLSLAMHGYGLSDDADTWLSVMLGTDVAAGWKYGPNQYDKSSGRGAYAAFLMRFYKDGHFMGNTFANGDVKGSIPDIYGVTKRIEYVFRFSAGAVAVSVGDTDFGIFEIPSLDNAYFSLRTHGSLSAYDVDVQINDKASASDAEYDLAASSPNVKVPIKTMGSELLGVYDENGNALGSDVCTLGANDITLNKSLFGTAEGDARTFYLVSTGGQSRFRVVTVDTTVVTFASDTLEFDKASSDDLTFSFDKRTLADLSVASTSAQTVLGSEDYTLTDNALTFKKDYLVNLKYGAYTFAVSGKRTSGEASESSTITVVVKDGRSPSVGFTEKEIDAAALADDLEIPVVWYDSEFRGLQAGTETVETSAYTVNRNDDITVSGSLVFALGYLESLPYGTSKFTLTTSKNSVSFAIVKTDGRAAIVPERMNVEKADVNGGFDVSGKWYDETVTSVTLDGKPIDYVKTLRAVRLGEDAVMALSLGEHTLTIVTNERTMTVVLTVSDGREPERVDDAAFDLSFPADMEIAFRVYDDTLVSVKRGDNPFPAASVNGNVVTIARSWFESAGLVENDEVTFDLIWIAADGTTEKTSTIVVGVIKTQIGDLGTFNLGTQTPLAFDVNLNRRPVLRVRIGENYVPFEYADGKITVPYSALENMPAGETAVVVETDRYLNATKIVFVDDRSPALAAVDEYISGNLEVKIRTYAYEITAVSVDGNALAADGYSYEDGILIVYSSALGEMTDGNHSLAITTEKDGDTVVVTAAFTAVTKQPPVVSAGLTYSLDDGGTLAVGVDFKNNLALKRVLLEGKELSTSLWSVGAYGSLTLKEGCFENLTAGVYKFTLVCDRASGDFTVTVTDARVNEFYTESVSVNAGEKEIALRARISNPDYKILVDGKEITDYVYDGGTIVIAKSVIKTLEAGKHTVAIVTAGGESTATIEIYKDTALASVLVGTGIGAGVIVALAAALLVACAVKRRKS